MNNSINNVIDLQNQPIDFIAFSGGGAKGAGYSGVHAALIDSQIIKGVKSVSGSSAGSIAAAAIASGISKEDYYNLTQNTNMKALLSDNPSLINNDGRPLLTLIRKTLKDNINKYFEEINGIEDLVNEEIKKIQQEIAISPDEETKSRLDNLLSIQKTNCKDLYNLKEKSNKVGRITFKDLDLLRTLDPKRFKGLIITATRKDNGELTIFNAKNSPNVEVADACRASASFPIVFKPHKIGGVKYIDGGYRDNIPIKYFGGEVFSNKNNVEVEDITNKKEKILEYKKQKRTMAFAFGDHNSEASIAIYSAKEKITDYNALVSFFLNVILKFAIGLGGKFKYTKEEEKLYKRIRTNALNTVVLDTGDVSTLSFDNAQKRFEYLNLKSYIQTMQHVENHDLGKTDENLYLKSFLLSVYEDTYKQSTKSKVTNSFVEGQEKKNESILDCIKQETWKTKEPNEVVKDFIIQASYNRIDGSLSTETRSMKKLINKLNDPSSSDKIKLHFIQLIGADPIKIENLKDFKFKKSDFQEILSKEVSNFKQRNKFKKILENQTNFSQAIKI